MMKKCISVVLMLSMLSVLLPVVHIGAEQSGDICEELLGYLQLLPENKEGYITNAELSSAVEKISDSEPDFEYEKADEAAKLEDLVYLMTVLLGYPKESYQKYTSEITNGVALSEKHIAKEVFERLVYNTLTAPKVTLSYFEGDRAVFEKKDTILKDKFDIIETDGIVEADFSAYINHKSERNLAKDEILIGNISARGLDNTKKYLGRRVRAFIKLDENDETSGELIAIEKKKNEEIKKTSEVIDGATTSKKLVWLDKEREELKSKEIPNNAVVIYNGKRMGESAGQEWSLFTPGDGEVNLIDNNSDNAADVVMIWNCNLYIADYVNDERIICRDFSYGTSIELKNKNYFIFDGDGNRLSLSDIKQFDVLSVTDSSEEDIYIFCSKKEPVEGIYRRSGYSIYVDNDKYSIGNSGLYNFLSFKDGDGVRVYFDIYDRTAYITALPENEYAFLNKVYYTCGEDEPMYLKLYTSDGVPAKKELADKVKVIFGDSEATYYKNKTGDNSFSVLAQLISNRCELIKCRENKSGKINRIVFPKAKLWQDIPNTTGGFDIYYADMTGETPDFKEAKYLQGMLVSRYRITSDTLLFSTEGDVSNIDGFKKMSVADLSGDSDYKVMVYDVNSRFEAGAVVFFEYTDWYSGSGSVVTEISSEIGADDEILTKIRLYTNGEENIIYAKNTDIKANADVAWRFGNGEKKLSELKIGDIIYHKLGADGYVSEFAYLHKNNSEQSFYHKSNYGWGDIYIPNCAMAVIYCPIKGLYDDMMVIYSDSSMPVMTASNRNYYICEGNRVRKTEYSELHQEDKMVGLWKWSALRDVVVYR